MAINNPPTKPITTSDISLSPVMRKIKIDHVQGSSTSSKVTSNIKETQEEDFKQSSTSLVTIKNNKLSDWLMNF